MRRHVEHVQNKWPLVFDKLGDKMIKEIQSDQNQWLTIEKEIVEKKKKLLRTFLSSVMKGSLFASVLMFSCVRADVFKLTNATGNVTVTPPGSDEANDFDKFIQTNPKELPMGAVNPFVRTSAAATKMIGYAVFFSASNGRAARQIYVVKKRGGNSVAISDNTIIGGSVFNFSSVEHTERQLAIQLVSVACGGVDVDPLIVKHNSEENPSAEPFVPAAKIGVGSFHIYTRESPCMNRNDSNNNFSCIEYHNALLAALPVGSTIDIYFSVACIDPEIIVATPALANNLITAVSALIIPLDVTLGDLFRIDDGVLQYNSAGLGVPQVWNNAAANLKGFVNRGVNRYLSNTDTPAENKTAIFTGTFIPPSNIVYHAI
jgi:hypothetical protein